MTLIRLPSFRPVWRRSNVLKPLAGRLPRLDARIADRAGPIVSIRLFARCAGVHVDFHAHRHFDNFRGLPGHCILPGVFGANSTPKLNLEPRPTPRKCGRSSVEYLRALPDRRYFSFGQSDFSLGQGPAGKCQSADKSISRQLPILKSRIEIRPCARHADFNRSKCPRTPGSPAHPALQTT